MFFKYIVFSMFLTISLSANASFGAITTATEKHTYTKFGKDISTILKKYKSDLKVLQSKGSIDNIDILLNKKDNASWGIIQSDALDYYRFFQAKKDITNKIKTVLPLYSKHIHILAKKGKKTSFKKGSKFNVVLTSKTNGANYTAHMIEKIYNLKFKYHYLDFQESLKQLQNGKVDIIIDVVSFPNKKFKDIKNVQLIELPKNKIMSQKYIRTKFPAKRYKYLTKNILGYKVPTIVVTNKVSKEESQAVGVFLKMILNNYAALIKYGHPQWKEAYRNKSLKVNNIHPTAQRILLQQ